MALRKEKATRRGERASGSKRVRRIPLGRIVGLAALLLVCALPVVFVNHAIAYVPLITAVAAVVVSYIYLRILERSLEFSEDSLLESCERGSEIEFKVTFKNNSPLVFVRLEPHFYISDLFGGIDTTMPATMTLMPREERDFSFDAAFEHLGTYSAGVRKIVIGDLLGLFSRTIENGNRHEVKVLPRIFDVSRMDLTNVSVQESRKAFQPIVTDDMDYAGVRAYVPGDPIKTIHWKLSSRDVSGDYYTRLFETFGNPGVSIIIDTTAPQYDAESLMQVFDGLMESALSLNEYARDCGIDSEMAYLDSYGESRKMRIVSITESDALIEDVPRVRVGNSDEGVELLRREGMSIHSQGNIAFCTAHVDDRIVSALLDIKLHDRNPLLFVVVPRALEGDARREFLRPLRRLDSAQIVYYVVSSAAELGKG